jgi:hypothetical protein
MARVVCGLNLTPNGYVRPRCGRCRPQILQILLPLRQPWQRFVRRADAQPPPRPWLCALATAASASANMRRAEYNSSWPANVIRTPPLDRLNRTTPRRASICRIRRLRVDCRRCSALAARRKLPSCAAAMTYRRCRSSIGTLPSPRLGHSRPSTNGIQQAIDYDLGHSRACPAASPETARATAAACA